MNANGHQSTDRRKRPNESILVVDDNPDQWLLMQQAMRQVFADTELIWVPDGQQAFAFLDAINTDHTRYPKLILLDLYLPERDQGWEFLQKIKADNCLYRHLPVVVLSQSRLPDDIIGVYERGGTSYTIKPVDPVAWVEYFETARQYWWETVTLPANR